MFGVKSGCGLACSLALMLGAAAADADPLPGSFWYAVDHITKTEDGARVLVWVTLPPAWHGQEVTVEAIDPEPVAVIDDPRTGNRVVEWVAEFDAEQPVLNAFFHYDFELTERPIRREFDPADVGEYDRQSDFYRRFTDPETWIQTVGPVLDQARRVVGEETDPWRQVESIYDWIVGELTYEVPGPPGRDAESVLEARRGDCEQFSILMTAMCRSLGIPARTVTTVWLTGGDHVFLEVWLEGVGWVPADPSLGQMLGPDGGGFELADVEYIMKDRHVPVGDPRWLLGNLFDGRLVVTVGNNISFDSPTLGHRVTLHSARPGGNRARPDGFRIEGLNRDLVHGGFHVFGERLADATSVLDKTHQRLASLYFDAGHHDVVEDVCRQSLQQDGEAAQPWMNMGRVYMHKGDYYKAEAAFRKALATPLAMRNERLDSLIWAHNYLGNCYDLLGNREMALEEYREVIERGNNHRGAMDYARRFLTRPFTKEQADNM